MLSTHVATTSAPAGLAVTSDGDLVARLQRGDAEAFETLVRTHSGRLLSVARRFLSNDQDAQDALQDAFIRAFRAIGHFESRAQLHTWLHRIVVNSALMKLRERRRKPEESIEDLLPTYAADGHQTSESREWSDAVLERKESARVVHEALARLPEQYRAVILLRDIEERDTAETAELLGTTANVVKVRLHRARQALRTLLDREFAGQVGPSRAQGAGSKP
jgi:RNA polymerase sigma-70 factor (ECF subfamily)